MRRLLFGIVCLVGGFRSAGAEDLLLLAADRETLQPVLQRTTDITTETRAAWTFWRGKLAGKLVVLARTEGDPLNAVVATTLALRLYTPRLVVVFGSARAHDPTLRAGDLVVSENFAAFEGMISPVATLGGGTDSLRWKFRPYPLMTSGEKETPTASFPADPQALAIARTLAAEHRRHILGTLGSAHQINREQDRLAWLNEHWKTSTEDGESAHVAGAAFLLHTPVIGLRIVDDATNDAARVVLRLVEAWK